MNRCMSMFAAIAGMRSSGLAPVELAWNHGFSARELNEIRRLIITAEDTYHRGME